MTNWEVWCAVCAAAGLDAADGATLAETLGDGARKLSVQNRGRQATAGLSLSIWLIHAVPFGTLDGDLDRLHATLCASGLRVEHVADRARLRKVLRTFRVAKL
jgi:hypothetical protein